MCHFTKSIKLSCPSSCVIHTSGDVVLDSSVHLSGPCRLKFSTKGRFTMNPGARITSPNIQISASEVILQANAALEASWNSTEPPNVVTNSTCGSISKNSTVPSLRFNLSAQDLTLGSVSVVSSKSITVFDHAAIKANGLAPGVNAGRILLQTQALSLQGQLSATGGPSKCLNSNECLRGGDGGQIMLEYVTNNGGDIESLKKLVSVYGGGYTTSNILVDSLDCLAGSAGALYRVLNSADKARIDALLWISNKGRTNDVWTAASSIVELNSFVTSLHIEDGAFVTARGDFRLSSPSFELEKKSDIKVRRNSVLLSSRPTMLLRAHDVQVDGNAQIYSDDTSVIAENINIGYNSIVNFKTKGVISGTSNVTIAGNVSGIGSESRLLISGGKLTLGGNIESTNVFLNSRDTLTITGNVTSRSNECLESPRGIDCNSTSWLDSLHKTVLVSRESIYIGQGGIVRPAVINASSILICSRGTVAVAETSAVVANSLGCGPSRGIGRGFCSLRNGVVVGGGGGFGGEGGHAPGFSGGSIYGNTTTSMVGSGGGCENAGAGGGIIQIQSPVLALNGSLEAQGGNGTTGAGGGGSGGFISLKVGVSMTGGGRISVAGGDGAQYSSDAITVDASENSSSNAFGGGGGGGRFVVDICRANPDSVSVCSGSFSGTYSVQGGYSRYPGTAGTSTGPVCPPGYSGIFCKACPAGTFKEDRGTLPCTPCKNAPENAHYSQAGSISRICEWVCDPGYSAGHSRVRCLAPFEKLVHSFGGDVGSMFAFLGMALALVALGFFFRKKKRGTLGFIQSSSANEGKSLLQTSSQDRIGGAYSARWWPFCFVKQVSYPKLKEHDLSDHVYRLYLFGDNTPSSPWRLDSNVPEELESIVLAKEYGEFINSVNAALSWQQKKLFGIFSIPANIGGLLYLACCVFVYPLASEVENFRRYRRLNALKSLISRYNHAFLRGTRARALLDSVKLGYTPDCSLAYIEILHKEGDSLPLDNIGMPRLPMVLLLSGSGTYKSPFFLDPCDLLVQAVPQCEELSTFIDDAWIELVAELNSRLRLVDRTALNATLLPVLTFLEQKSMSCYLGDLNIQLGRFYPRASKSTPFKLGIMLSIASDTSSFKHSLQHDYDSQSQKRQVGIREDALRIRSRSIDASRATATRPGLDAAIDRTLPIPGILWQLQDVQAWHETGVVPPLVSRLFFEIKRRVLPRNLPTSQYITSTFAKIFFLLMCLLVDLGLTIGIVVNLRCINNGETNDVCSASILAFVMIFYPMALIVSPVIGIISIAVGTSSLAKKYSEWNALSMINSVCCIFVCYIESSSLVSPWFTSPLPLVPVLALLTKFSEGYVVELYIADLETERKRRGWRGLIHSPIESPNASPTKENRGFTSRSSNNVSFYGAI